MAANLQVVNGTSGIPSLNVSENQLLQSIRETVAKGATDAEFIMFMHLVNRYQLDPFLREIWFIKYGNTPTIMVSRDGLRNYAQRQEDFEGLMSQEVRKGDEFKYNPITGEIHHVMGDGSGPITKAYAIVYRTGKKPHIEMVDFQEYFQALSGKNPVWKTHPSAMIKKVAEVLALKKCYTITGLYAPEEIGMQEEPINVTPEHEKSAEKRQRMATVQQKKKIFAVAHEKKISDQEIRECMIALTGKESTKQLTFDEAQQLIEYFETYQPRTIEHEPEKREANTDEILDAIIGSEGKIPEQESIL